MTPFALRLCFRDPARDDDGYGGERASFVVMAEDLPNALCTWLDRADDKGVELQIVEEAGPVTGNDFADLVDAATAGGIAVGQSYGYAPLDPPKGVFFGLITDESGWLEVATKAKDAGHAVRALLAAASEEGHAVTSVEGLCDLSQTTDDATFQGQALPMAALALGMQAPGTVQFGASYAHGDAEH